MKRTMEKTINRYSMVMISCKAYFKAMMTTNSISGFRKTGCYPLCPDVIVREQLLPSEVSAQVMTIKTGRGAVDDVFVGMVEKKKQLARLSVVATNHLLL